MENRIIYSADDMMQTVENALDKLNTLRYDDEFRTYLGNGIIDKMSMWDRQIRKRKNDPFTIVVVGDFKRGKSTFINALLGEEVVPVDVTTETVTFNCISYGPSSNEAILSGCRRMRLSNEELKREELEKIIDQTGEVFERIELKRPLEILKDITIIDTPGTGDSMKDFSPQVEEYLLQADAVVYVYSVKYPLSQTEQMFLKTAVLPQQYTKLFVVGNYMDTIGSEEDYERVRESLAERVHRLLPETEVITVSALDELCRQLHTERPCEELAGLLEGQFDKLRNSLNDLIASKKDIVIIDRMQRMIHSMIDDLNKEIELIEYGLDMSSEEAEKHLQELKEKQQDYIEKQEEILNSIDSIVQDMSTEANTWMLSFAAKLRAETTNLENASTDDILKYYSCYCVDMMQQALNVCIDYHKRVLFEKMESISATLAKDIIGDFRKSEGYNFSFSLNNKIWTTGDNLGLAVSVLSSTGMLATVASLAADGVSGLFRQNEVQMSKKDILRQIPEQMKKIEASVSNTITGIYSRLGEKAKKHILQFYEEELNDAQRMVNQSVSIANSEGEKKEKIRSLAKRARQILQDAALEQVHMN